ncbi:unnamed protein product [Caenorhabditis auriculariae]|uniref:Helitron helicase-like domain-containing protein n=1 Tax=Caenorhabditis auriculariae TaxID=2777116 RepID=A0A8S1HYM5_9PELO|nr:unnamed protein product [Caenorhabditis auriculariae]
MDSLHWCRFFKRRLESFFSNVLMEKEGPLGTLIHYFWRLEYQQRGTQHVHCLFWALEKPKEDAAPQEVADFLDKHLTTCRIQKLNQRVSLWDMFKLTTSITKMFKSKLDLFAKRRNVEIMDVLLSHELFGFDTGHVFLNTNEDAKGIDNLFSEGSEKEATDQHTLIISLIRIIRKAKRAGG